MIELLLSALIQLTLLSQPNEPTALSADAQLEATSSTPPPAPEPEDPNYGGSGTWDDDN